jgi:exosortase
MIYRIKAFSERVDEMQPSGKNWLFLALSLILTLFFLPALTRLYHLSISSEMYSHLLLIPFVTGYLIFLKRKEAYGSPRTVNARDQVLSIAAAVLLLSGGFITSDLTLYTAAYVLFFWAIFLFVYGSLTFEIVLFPLFFLIFLVPTPSEILGLIIRILLWGSDHVTAFLFSLIGIPFLHEDYVFRLPRLSIYIAPECSGIRSSTALFLTAMLADYLILSRWWSRSLLLAAVIPLAVFKNGLRIVTLSVLAIYVDEGFMSGNLHRRGGFVFFGITLLVMGLILILLRKSENWFGKK